MNRRGLFHGAVAAMTGLLGARAVAEETKAPMKVVYHLSDFEKADFVLQICACITRTPAGR